MQSMHDNERNTSICELEFGNGKAPFYIWKEDVDEFLRAIVPVESDTTEALVKGAVEGINKGDYSRVNALISSRGMIVQSSFKNDMEYINSATNGRIFIRSIKMNGERTHAFPYSDRKPEFQDIYPD